MKAFKIYFNGKAGVKGQIKWLGALLIVMAIVVGVISVYNYFQFPSEDPSEFVYSVRALIIKEMYVAAGVGILGVILLLAGSFAVSTQKKNRNKMLE